MSTYRRSTLQELIDSQGQSFVSGRVIQSVTIKIEWTYSGMLVYQRFAVCCSQE